MRCGFSSEQVVNSIHAESMLFCLFIACACLQNDFTPEEEEEVRKENQWAFE